MNTYSTRRLTMHALSQVVRLAAFCAVPVLGPAAYVCARPALPEE